MKYEAMSPENFDAIAPDLIDDQREWIVEAQSRLTTYRRAFCKLRDVIAKKQGEVDELRGKLRASEAIGKQALEDCEFLRWKVDELQSGSAQKRPAIDAVEQINLITAGTNFARPEEHPLSAYRIRPTEIHERFAGGGRFSLILDMADIDVHGNLWALIVNNATLDRRSIYIDGYTLAEAKAFFACVGKPGALEIVSVTIDEKDGPQIDQRDMWARIRTELEESVLLARTLVIRYGFND